MALSTTNVKHKGRAPSTARHASSAPQACNESKLLLIGQLAPFGKEFMHLSYPLAQSLGRPLVSDPHQVFPDVSRWTVRQQQGYSIQSGLFGPGLRECYTSRLWMDEHAQGVSGRAHLDSAGYH